MEVDGMYENTPWERLSLHAPWIALGALAFALLLFIVMRARAKSAMRTEPARAFLLASDGDAIARDLGALSIALLSLGALFTKYWRPAHDTYPTIFGSAALRLIAVSVVVGIVVALLWRKHFTMAITYTLVTATAAAAAAVSAFSHSIIAEGQVTAMVLPVGYVVCAIAAAAVTGVVRMVGIDDIDLLELLSAALFIAGAWFISYKLPVVQFHEDSSLFPVTGGLYIVALGRLARLSVLPRVALFVAVPAAIAIGYLLGLWYGIAIAAVGLSISGAWGLRRPTSAEFPLPHSAAA